MLMFIRTEVLSVSPPIVKYHQLLPQGQVEDFIRETDAVQMAQGTIMVKDSLNRNIWQDSLVVNGTFIRHSHSPPLVNSFNHMQNRIGALNLAKSEMFHVKKYRPGGHYAPHLDYLVVMPPGEDHLGNRIATLMLILKPAELGGGTVFPNAGVHFRPAAGDALLWMNMNPDYSVAQGSFHGACPVLAGTKIGVTMWIRSAGQELRMPCPLKQEEHFDTRLFTHFEWRPKTFWAYLDCYIRPDRKCAHPKLKRGRYTV
ncbi:CBN-PHY-4 protein [Aphelenchoides avenae]|nr:CBN-PHY-4 protein [Aphelenchus avenae]